MKQCDDRCRPRPPGLPARWRVLPAHPAPDPARSAAFYRAAFAWSIRDAEDSPAFEDGTGHVIGHFIRGLPVAGHAGHVPYVYVDSVDETLDKVTANGGTIIRPPFPEGDLWVATAENPAGILLGIWQRGPRHG
jgi:uncharacterized protein